VSSSAGKSGRRRRRRLWKLLEEAIPHSVKSKKFDKHREFDKTNIEVAPFSGGQGVASSSITFPFSPVGHPGLRRADGYPRDIEVHQRSEGAMRAVPEAPKSLRVLGAASSQVNADRDPDKVGSNGLFSKSCSTTMRLAEQSPK
jgi:hypothetical protein